MYGNSYEVVLIINCIHVFEYTIYVPFQHSVYLKNLAFY